MSQAVASVAGHFEIQDRVVANHLRAFVIETGHSESIRKLILGDVQVGVLR